MAVTKIIITRKLPNSKRDYSEIKLDFKSFPGKETVRRHDVMNLLAQAMQMITEQAAHQPTKRTPPPIEIL